MFAVTRSSLLKGTDPKLFFSRESLKTYKRVIFVYTKVRYLHLLCHLPRCCNFLLIDLSVFKFDWILSRILKRI